MTFVFAKCTFAPKYYSFVPNHSEHTTIARCGCHPTPAPALSVLAPLNSQLRVHVLASIVLEYYLISRTNKRDTAVFIFRILSHSCAVCTKEFCYGINCTRRRKHRFRRKRFCTKNKVPKIIVDHAGVSFTFWPNTYEVIVPSFVRRKFFIKSIVLVVRSIGFTRNVFESKLPDRNNTTMTLLLARLPTFVRETE